MASKNFKVKINLQKIINLLLILVIVLNFAFLIFQHKDRYFNFDYWKNFPSLEKTFLKSQYVDKHATAFIPDETAFSYSAGKLIKGTSPVLVVPDAPPLGKYIIGLSTLIFNNDAISIIIAGVLCLFAMYLVSFQVFKNITISLLPPLLLTFEQIFKNQFIYVPLLDIFQLVFILFSFYFFNKGRESKKVLLNFCLASLFLGFFIATKFFMSGLSVAGAFIFVLLASKDNARLVKLISSLPISAFILLLSYVRVFAFGYTFMKFLGIQKWVYLYHQSFLILPLSVWPLLMLNKWYVWFGNNPVISDPQWSLTWPILVIISTLTLVFYLIKKFPQNKNIEILLSWSFLYLLFLSLGETFSRYFVILIPILYIISIYGMIAFVKMYKK